MYSHNPQIHGSCHPLLFPVPPHNEGHPSGEVLATLASTFLRLLANLGKFSCLGGRPAQALQQAGFPQSWSGWLRDPELVWVFPILIPLWQVPWGPLMPDLYTRFMNSFNLPVTYGGSGVHIKHGISGTACIGSITKWIIHTLGPDSESQDHLNSLLVALQSYYHPANSNNSSELLHVFISCLCTYFVDRVHIERYNKKWETKVKF